MAPRLQLQSLLEALLGTDKVYYQPPASVQMEYPCIVYSRDNGDTKFANDVPYLYEQRYQVTVIARDPDAGIHLQVAKLPKTLYSRNFVVDNLHHDVFEMYF